MNEHATDKGAAASLPFVYSQFAFACHVFTATEILSGNINDTFLVEVDSGARSHQRFILQRINSRVFADPIAVVENGRRVADHIAKSFSLTQTRIPQVVRTLTGSAAVVDQVGGVWRVLTYVDGKSLSVVRTAVQAQQMGRALAEFHAALLDFESSQLSCVLPGLHDVTGRVGAFEAAIDTAAAQRRELAAEWIEQVHRYLPRMTAVCSEVYDGSCQRRVIHGDAKIENVLYDQADKCCSIVDLDTVMPGNVAIDVGDFMRTAGAKGAEDNVKSGDPLSDSCILAALSGYLSKARDFLTADEVLTLPLAGAAAAFALGVRFLTDWLEGDQYFRVNYPLQNLNRTRAQLAIVESILLRRAALSDQLRRSLLR